MSKSKTISEQITEEYGIFLTTNDLAQVLRKTPTSLRHAFCRSTDPVIRRLHGCARHVGRRVLFPSIEVGKILEGVGQ